LRTNRWPRNPDLDAEVPEADLAFKLDDRRSGSIAGIGSSDRLDRIAAQPHLPLSFRA
jgi:hypothetical protein